MRSRSTSTAGMRRAARCHSRLVPAMPPPMISTSAFSGRRPGCFSGGGAQNGVLMAPNRIRRQVDFETYDVLVVGGGLAGIRAAIAAVEANPRVRVGMVSKVYPMRSHTVSAEGGAAAAIGPGDSYETHAFDTIKGSDYLADQDVVEAFVREAPVEVIQMEHWGCPWSRNPDGSIAVRPFGGMTTWRTCFAADKTGFHMLHAVFQTSLKYPQITRHDEAFVTKLLVEDSRCIGVVALDIRTGRFDAITAKSVILATGGLGRVYAFTTNGNICTGDGMSLAYRAGAGLKDMETVILGLYAAGECANVGLNGGNRLGSNSLSECLVFGAAAGRAAAHYASSAKAVTANPVDAMLWDEARRVESEYLEKKGGAERIGPIREEMQREMDAGAGVFRNKEGLSRLARNLGGLRERFEKVKVDDSSRTFNTEIVAALELDFMLEVSSVIAFSALAREESRGAHARTDFPERHDDRLRKHTVAFPTNTPAPRLDYRDVKITHFQPQARTY